MTTFKNYNFKPFIDKTLSDFHFSKPTEIQSKVLKTASRKQNIVGISKTGSGKTLAFLLPILQSLELDKREVQAIIAAPTRELATQIHTVLKSFVKNEEKLKIMLTIGGTDRERDLAKGEQKPHIVIGTPGRLKDLFESETQQLSLHTAKTLVLDEADMICEYGFLEDIDSFAGKLSEKTQLMFFSATIPENLQHFIRKYASGINLIDLNENNPSSIEHIIVETHHKGRVETLEKIMSIIDPYICLIFCSTRESATSLYQTLTEHGYRVGQIHGDLQARERKQYIKRINQLAYQYIVCTDIAARGIDIDGVSHVIQYDLPKDLSFVIHRAGRCGRANYTGINYILYEKEDERVIEQLEKLKIAFTYQVIKNGQLVVVENRHRNQKAKKENDMDSEIAKKIMTKKKMKVKPGYKKKLQTEVAREKRKQKRTMIRQDIKKRQKQRAKSSQIRNANLEK